MSPDVKGYSIRDKNYQSPDISVSRTLFHTQALTIGCASSKPLFHQELHITASLIPAAVKAWKPANALLRVREDESPSGKSLLLSITEPSVLAECFRILLSTHQAALREVVYKMKIKMKNCLESKECHDWWGLCEGPAPWLTLVQDFSKLLTQH
jgi:hypothetical protein